MLEQDIILGYIIVLCLLQTYVMIVLCLLQTYVMIVLCLLQTYVMIVLCLLQTYVMIVLCLLQPTKEEDTQRHSDSSLEEKVFKQAPKELTEEKRRSARRREYVELLTFAC